MTDPSVRDALSSLAMPVPDEALARRLADAALAVAVLSFFLESRRRLDQGATARPAVFPPRRGGRPRRP